jgi:pyruvate/2-oxoacid:ferredoxin oxidoreductase alpha subunit
MTDDAEYVIVIMASAAGVAKDTVDALRGRGVKAGCLRVRMFRPFPAGEAASALDGKRAVAVLDRACPPEGRRRSPPRSVRPCTASSAAFRCTVIFSGWAAGIFFHMTPKRCSTI